MVKNLNFEGTRAPFHPIKITDLNPERATILMAPSVNGAMAFEDKLQLFVNAT